MCSTRLAACLLGLLALRAQAEPLWIAVGSEGRRIASADGLHWSHDRRWPEAQSGALRAIAFGAGRFVAVGGSEETGRAASTSDGETWQEWPSVGGAIPVLAFGAGGFVAMHGGELLRSESEARFTAGDRLPWPGAIRPQSVACGDTEAGFRFVFLGEADLEDGAVSWRAVSGDGLHWEHAERGTAPARSVAYGAGIFVVAGPSGLLETSHDGQTWTRRELGGADDLESIVWTGARFVAQGMQLWSSRDGLAWHDEGKAPGRLLWARDGGPALAISWSGQLQSSSDWQHWIPAELPPGPTLTGVAGREP